MKLNPAKGMLVVRFMESPTTLDPSSGGIPAIVEAVGPKVDCKEGDSVLLKPFAKYGLQLGDGTVLIDEICVGGELKSL